jgi:hypothetical protein
MGGRCLGIAAWDCRTAGAADVSPLGINGWIQMKASAIPQETLLETLVRRDTTFPPKTEILKQPHFLPPAPSGREIRLGQYQPDVRFLTLDVRWGGLQPAKAAFQAAGARFARARLWLFV